MNYLMCTEFINFIKENGRDILKNPQNFEASLQAYCSTKLTSNVYKTEAFILTEALREGIIQELLEVKIVSDTLIRKLSKQLQATCGFTEYASNGAIDTWCYALGLKEVPVQKVEEARTEESNIPNKEGLYIATKSHLYGINNFLIFFSIWVLCGALGVYINYKNDSSLVGLIVSFLLFSFTVSILYFAVNSKAGTLKLIKYYLCTMFSLNSIVVIIAIVMQLIPNLPFVITLVLGGIGIFNLSVAYWLFIYFSKSDRIKATFGQYLAFEGFSLAIRNVSYNEYLRLNGTRIAPIKSNLISSNDARQSGKNKMLFGILSVIGGFIVLVFVLFDMRPGTWKYILFSNIGGWGIIIGIVQFIRGFIQKVSNKTSYSTQYEKDYSESSTNRNYSQNTESANTSSSTNTNYTKQSQKTEQQNSDADYNEQTSNQSTKKEEPPKKEKTFEDRLEELKRLHEKGIITAEEFQTRKTEILKEL